MNKKGIFIVFEGIDGSGKSTQAKFLEEFLSSKNETYLTCEPTFNPIGQMIRDIFSGKINSNNHVITGLFVADRLDHILNEYYGIISKLEKGINVISDRYYFSSFAYQGAHVPFDWVVNANQQSMELLKANITFFIDVKPDICFERIKNNRNNIDYYETKENLLNVYKTYLKAFDLLNKNENIIFIDGNRDKYEIRKEIISYIENYGIL